jgi:ABC-type sugar transport system substrate-binding protein
MAVLAMLGVLTVAGVIAGGAGARGTTASGGGEAHASAGHITIAVNEYTREIPYFAQILTGIRTAAKPLGWTINATFGNNDPTEQANQIQNAVATHPTALVVIPVDKNALIPPIQQAKASGVPVLAMGDNLAPSGYSAMLSFVGSNYTTLGVQKARWLVSQLHGHGTIGFIHGIRGLDFSESQATGAMSVFNHYPKIKIVDGGYTGAFSSDTGLTLTENLLTRDPNLNAIYFDNDDIALGGIQALKERGIPKSKVLVIGTDGGPAALAQVKAGVLNYTVSLCGFRQGKQAVQLLQNYLVKHIQPKKISYEPDLVFTPATYAKAIKQVNAGNC